MEAGAQLVNGLVLKRIDPYGKHLFYRFGSPSPKNATTVHVHLGLFGKFTRHKGEAPVPRDTVRMRMATDAIAIDLTGPTDCRIMDLAEETTIRARLGPDPLRKDADPELAWERIRKRRSTIGEALMDQKVMAGIGNVYRAEALFVNAIHPNRPANTLTKTEFDALWTTMRDMLTNGVKDKRKITLEPQDLKALGLARSRVASKEAVYVYKKDHCFRCETPVQRWDLAGRWAYACPECQRV
jgi:endonuclease VIII